MIKLSYRHVIWVLAGGGLLGMVVGFLVFHHTHKTAATEVKQQFQVQAKRGPTEPKNEAIIEKPSKSFQEISEKQSAPATTHHNVDSLGQIRPPSESSDPRFTALVKQPTADVIKDSELQFAKTENKLEETKRAFSEAVTNQGNVSLILITLIRNAHDEEKAWIYNALVGSFNSETDPAIRRACLVGINRYPPDKASKLLLQALSDEDMSVRTLAAKFAGRSFTEKEANSLYLAIQEDKGLHAHGRGVARNAIVSLGIIGGRKTSEILREIWNNKELSKGCKGSIVSALGLSGDVSNFEILKSVLESKEAMLQSNAVSGLTALAGRNRHDQRVADKVKKLLVNYVNDKDHTVQGNVVNALGSIGDSDDIHLLQPLLDDTYSSIVSYTEDGEVKTKVVYPIRESAKRAIDRINARLLKASVN